MAWVILKAKYGRARNCYGSSAFSLQLNHSLLLRYNFHSAGLHMLGLWQVQGQDAVSVAGFDALGIDGGGQGERLLELTLLETVPVNRRAFGNGRFCLPLERNR